MLNLITSLLIIGACTDIVFGNIFPTARDLVEIIDVELPASSADPKYRVDCAPDTDQYHNFCPLDPKLNIVIQKPVLSAGLCQQRGCEYDTNPSQPIPTCYIPSDKGGYGFTGYNIPTTDALTTFNLTRLPPKNCPAKKKRSKRSSNPTQKFSLSNSEIEKLTVTVSQSGSDKLRLTIRDLNAKRYEVPVPINWISAAPQSVAPKLQFQLTRNMHGQVGFRVTRSNNSTILFDTSSFAHGFIYDDRFIQFITTIPSQNVYGFGENTHPTFRHELKNSKRYPIFARDQWPVRGNQNLYGTHPFYMIIEPNGATSGIFIFNSNAQDYKFDEYETNQATLTYRTIGGILDIFFFAGPNPEDVIRQYQSVIGQPYMPPYWSLGFQLSRYGFNNLTNMRAALNRTLTAQIPLDVLYGDIDYFRDQLDFTYDTVRFAGLPAFIDSLHQSGMKFITILDPAINSEEKAYSTYTDGQSKNIWIKWPQDNNLQYNETKNRNMLGYVWPFGKTVFPDFLFPAATDWWIDEILKFHDTIKFDGLWIDMNEPANFGTNDIAPFNWNDTMDRTENWTLNCPVTPNTLDNPFYKTAACGNTLADKTLCMIGEQTDANGVVYHHYDVHNIYGWSETVATLAAARKLGSARSIIISRSTFPTSGTMAGHWLGDNASEWEDLKMNLIGMLEFNLFGIPYIGSDICGFVGNTTEELCQRWMQLGAFNPFFRNHNSIKNIDQDPGNFGEDAVASNRAAVTLRYTLNPFLYTLFHRVHISGGTVIRSMAHVFPSDPQCWDLDEQFMWGSSLLIAPVLRQGEIQKHVFLPKTERWYDYYTGENQTTLDHKNVSAPLNYIPLYLRGGAIIPHQEPAMNTVESRKNPFYFKVALDQRLQASGDLFWDDGDSLNTYQSGVYNYFSFTFNKNRLIIEPWTYRYNGMHQNNVWNSSEIFGFPTSPSQVLVNGEPIPASKWTYNAASQVLKLENLQLNVSRNHRLVFL